jgi:peroxisomal enoyl-CoA hydratase 2
METTKS